MTDLEQGVTDGSTETAAAAALGGKLLAGLRIVECSVLGPGAISTPLADLGADVIKVEAPAGEDIRTMGCPTVEGSSLLHLHVSRGKRSIVLDLATKAGREVFLDLVRVADAVVEAMRPGGLERRGLGFDRLREVNPLIVMVTVTGFGMTGPYRDLLTDGIAYDTWAGVLTPTTGPEGMPSIPDRTPIGVSAGPLYGTAALLAGVLRARTTGQGVHLEIAQADAAAAFDWLRSESYRAHVRVDGDGTGAPSDGDESHTRGTAAIADTVRYQFYESADGHVLLMAAEQKFWRNFCAAIGRDDLYAAKPGPASADSARADLQLRRELAAIFATRTSADWIELGLEYDIPIGPVNTPVDVGDDPQFAHRMPWQSADRLVAEQLPCPVRIVGEAPPVAATPAPSAGAHSEQVLTDALGYDARRVATLRASGAFGPTGDTTLNGRSSEADPP
jgi:crotonobetainyl-CoA:carnitine CoA-transferase CaiB-like acyl-CoA transferase